jgi:uncharacterized delta-60 repeat protein
VIGLAVFGLGLVWLGTAWAGAGALDPTFDPGVGVKSIPFLWGRQNYTDYSGKMLMFGSFKQMGGYDRRGIARVNADSTLDTSFNAPIEPGVFGGGYINNWALLDPGSPNSQIIICGDFTVQSSSGTYHGLARLNHDGSVDPTFTHTFTSSDGIQGLTRQSTTGKLIVCGSAMSVKGYPGTAYYLVRLDANGNVLEDNFMRSGVGGYVYGSWSYPSTDPTYPNQVRLFGSFPRWSDPTKTDHMVRLDVDGGTVHEKIGEEIVNGPILFLTYQGTSQGNCLVIVGAFTQVHGTTKNNIARLLPGGGLDTTFNIGTGANGHVKRVTNDGAGLVLNGYFNDFNGKSCGYMVRLNNNGSVDENYKIGTGADDRIWNAFKDYNPDGTWANTWTVVGAFQSFNGQARQCFASLAADGSLRDQFASFITGYQPSTPKVYGIRFAPVGGGLYVFGDFSGYGGKLHRRVARVNYSTGAVDGSFRAGMGGVVYDADTDWAGGGKLLVAGHINIGEGYVGCTSLARLNLDGSMDLDFKPLLAKADGTLPDLFMIKMCWDGSGDILVGGDFASVNGVARSGIVRLNSNGTLDAGFTFNPASMPGLTNIMVTHTSDDTGGPLRVFGKATYQGAPVGFMARLLHGGGLDTSFANGPSPVPHVVIFNGEVKGGFGDENTGIITVGGAFTQIFGGNNPPLNYLARFSADGMLDYTFNPPGPNGPIYAMEGQWYTDKIIIGGDFTAYNGVGRNHIARLNWNGSLDSSFDPGTGTNGPVHAILYNPQDQKALIGGSFTTYNGDNRRGIAQIMMGGGNIAGVIDFLLNSAPAP